MANANRQLTGANGASSANSANTGESSDRANSVSLRRNRRRGATPPFLEWWSSACSHARTCTQTRHGNKVNKARGSLDNNKQRGRASSFSAQVDICSQQVVICCHIHAQTFKYSSFNNNTTYFKGHFGKEFRFACITTVRILFCGHAVFVLMRPTHV